LNTILLLSKVGRPYGLSISIEEHFVMWIYGIGRILLRYVFHCRWWR